MGIAGAILAVPTTAILQVLYQELVPDEDDV
jgi:predicted PurR-regulated permease PerM